MASTIRSPLDLCDSMLERNRNAASGTQQPKNRTSGLKRSPLAKQSKKRKAESKIYSAKRKAFLEAHLFCEFTGCCNQARDVHHMQGRTGGNYLNEKTWMAICRKHHTFIHDNPRQARVLGFLA